MHPPSPHVHPPRRSLLCHSALRRLLAALALLAVLWSLAFWAMG